MYRNHTGMATLVEWGLVDDNSRRNGYPLAVKTSTRALWEGVW